MSMKQLRKMINVDQRELLFTTFLFSWIYWITIDERMFRKLELCMRLPCKYFSGDQAKHFEAEVIVSFKRLYIQMKDELGKIKILL